MANNMNRAFECRKSDLRHIKLGSVLEDDPHFVWVKMIDRINVVDKVLAVQNQFNTAMEDALAPKPNHSMIDINQYMNNSAYFLATHKSLTDEGAARFWSLINSKVQNFEKQLREQIQR